MSVPAAPQSTLWLTTTALWLLDIPFEPASAAAGELFDRVVEHVSAELTRVGAALGAGTTCEPLVLSLPCSDQGQRRRDQLLLRREVLAGHHPAGTATLREAEIRMRQAINDLTRSRCLLTDPVAHGVAIACALLAAVVRIVEMYRRSTIRLQHNMVVVDPDLRRQAGLAARAERDLIRRMRQAVQSTYGVREISAAV